MTRRALVAVAAVLLVIAASLAALAVSRPPGGGDATGPEPRPTATAAPSPSPSGTSPPRDAAPSPAPSASPTALDVPPDAPAQLRGIWVHLFDRSLKTREGIQAFLDAAVAAHFNTVIVQGARRHDAFHESSVLPRTSDDELAPGLDVLGELVPAAHERGLQVHAWYSLAPTTHPTMMDEQLGPDHISTRHGFGSDAPWLQAGNDRAYDYADPAIPAFQDHVVAMLRDTVERYDVDGIHLDYLRYECLQVGAGGTCLDADPGDPATPNQHPVTMRRFAAHGEGTLAAFLRAQTRDLVRRVYVELAEVDPTVVVSAALIAQGDGPGADRQAFARTKAWWNKAQDWATWIEEGIVDHAYPMAYFREDDPRWARAFDDWVAFAGLVDTDDQVVAVGQAAYLNCVDDSLAQLAEGAAATDGVVVYSYQGDVVGGSRACPGDTPGDLLRALSQGMFAAPARVPEVPRRTDPTAGHLLVRATDGQTVTVSGPGQDPRSRRADATGHAGFVWVSPGQWQVTVAGGNPRQVTVEAGKVTRLDAS